MPDALTAAERQRLESELDALRERLADSQARMERGELPWHAYVSEVEGLQSRRTEIEADLFAQHLEDRVTHVRLI